MPGRHRQQVRSRYQRTLDENVRHGRWTDQEDLLLMSAVARFGAKDWNKIAKAVYGSIRWPVQRTVAWCNVLDKCTESGDWTPEEDERLALGIRVFGREKWSKIAEILPRHSPESVRNRYQQLLTAKMRVSAFCRVFSSMFSPLHFCFFFHLR
ncbi:Myb-like DNA-binding domain protein [Oesophagostomum dentatum]|uniref:Myb-like DNA-binding domain protein n=1 Tax=Oesophagostomum dentatum TaxID=61180 RepID=A0A0B1SA52_OESDE|nr:Myb-like DNA-binding domain protein [Oesophagostomum dentatum]